MQGEITSERRPIKLWIGGLDRDTLAQARNLANLPHTFRHVAIMPDAHVGYGMPIGGVLATRDVVIPNAVGVDIGCGMGAVRTSLTNLDRETLKRILGRIRQAVPLGFKHHRRPQDERLMPSPPPGGLEELPVVRREYLSARRQLGTLGGGNHFIEIQQGQDGHVWIMVHSGSRNLGYKVAGHYNRLAQQENERARHPVPRQWQLAGLCLDSETGRRYLAEMEYCVRFAEANRELMLRRVMEIFQEEAGPVEFGPIINVAHNYAALERHFGSEVIVHRKGATSARAGEYGIIPGSQGTNSYIVRGLGNPEAFMSCSHGAGRVLGRKQAQRVLDLEEERRRLEARAILHSLRSRRDLEEAPSAYKDIGQVLRSQEDLVEVVEELRPLAVIKG